MADAGGLGSRGEDWEELLLVPWVAVHRSLESNVVRKEAQPCSGLNAQDGWSS